MGSSLLSEKERERRQKEKRDIQLLQTAASPWCLDGSGRKSRQPLKSCWDFQERGVVAGSVCVPPPAAAAAGWLILSLCLDWKLCKDDKCLWSFSFDLN